MHHINTLASVLKLFIQRHTRMSIAIGILFIALGMGATAFVSSDTPANSIKDTKKHGDTTHTLGAEKSESTVPKTETNTPANPTTTPNTVTSTKTKPTPPPSPSNQQFLTISPASITIKAGETFKGITIKANDGKAVTMPMFLSSTPPEAFFNFPGSPAQTTWNGDIVSLRTKAPGTYTMEVIAQAVNAVHYRGTMTIVISPTPLMTLTVHPLGYDAENDAVIYIVEAVRHDGYSQVIERVTAVTPGQGLECATQAINADTYALACAYATGPRPTSGTIFINAFTASEVISGDTSFSLPPL